MVTSSQLAKVEAAIHDLVEHPHKPWMHNIDAAAAVEYIHKTAAGQTQSLCAVVGGVFVMYAVGQQWWAAKPVLAEEMLLRIEPGADLASVLAFMERTAQLLDCSGVALGTSISTSDVALMRLYRQFGYVESANVMYKET